MIATSLLIHRSEDADGVVLALDGELDLSTAHVLEARLSEIIAESHPRVLLDLRELRFVDSAGVSVLIRAKDQAAAEGRQLVLRRPTAQVHAIFALVGLVEWLAFDDR